MQWFGRRESDNVDDRRGFTGGHAIFGGGIIGVIIIVIKLFMGESPTQVMSEAQQAPQTTQTAAAPLSAEDEKMGHMVRVILADNEDVWNKLFTQQGKQYEEPKLVLFRGATQSDCGGANSATGPFYCPTDHKVYIDLSFFDELKNRFGANGGDFAVAYVIAHEVGHHVQNLLGTFDKVQAAEQGLSEKEINKISVSVELQADFYAGVFAHYDDEMNHVIEPGDIENALSAASAVGDDHLQKQAQGYIVPDAFTHGTSAERVYWFKKGYKTGDISEGNTFANQQPQ